MISVCPARSESSIAPLIVEGVGKTILFLTDGSGAWGCGIEAAAWFQDWLQKQLGGLSHTTPTTITQTLQTGIESLPDTFTDAPLHWTFCIIAAIVTDSTIQLGSCGGFAAARLSPSCMEPLLRPARPIDELVAQGRVSESEAEQHKYARLLSGPFFGHEGQNDLVWLPPVPITCRTQIIIGDCSLLRYLKLQPQVEWHADVLKLRDAIEQFSGYSAPTALLSFP